jgi:hypothetical protein
MISTGIHLKQDVDLAMMFDKPHELRTKTLVVPMRELAGDARFQYLAAVLFIEPNRHGAYQAIIFNILK